MLILAAPVDKSGKSTTAACGKDLDLGSEMHFLGSERQRQQSLQVLKRCIEMR